MHNKHFNHQRWKLPPLILIAILVTLCSLHIGAFSVPFAKLFPILYRPFTLESELFTAVEHHIIWQIRIPRIMIAFCAGAVLALSGAALQGVFNNPLVDPHIIGVTSGAAFGGCLAILLGVSASLLVISTFFFSFLTLLLVYLTAIFISQGNRVVLILAGVILNGFFSALVSLMQYLADNEEVLPSIVFWLLGSFATANWEKITIFLPLAAIGSYVLIRLRWRLNVLSLGDMQAKMLGESIAAIRWLILLCATLLIAAQVSVSGSIGWVGLIIPHFTRFLVGNNNRHILPATFIIGGSFMVIIDTISRTLTSAEIPIGIVTALFGAPFFTLLLLKNYQKRPL